MASDSEDVTLECFLKQMGVPELFQHMNSNGISVTKLRNLQVAEIPLLLPAPQFNASSHLHFMQKYSEFFQCNSLALHPSFLGVTGTVASSSTVQVVDSSEDNNNNDDDDDQFSFHLSDEEDSDSEYEPQAKQKKQSNRAMGSSSKSSGFSEAAPLVNPNIIGAKRKMTKDADKKVDALDLKVFYDEHPVCSAIMFSYGKTNSLTDDDRSTLTRVLVIELLKYTDYPTRDHYECLTGKICKLFPSEKSTIWYRPPKSENAKQLYAKGRLPDKVKNCKTKLRKKGKLPTLKKRLKEKLEKPIFKPGPLSDEEKKCVEWLARNREPFADVRTHWRGCSQSRLRELLANPDMSSHDYVGKWHDILKLPSSHKLILDDFEMLPEVDPDYDCLRGKADSLLMNWAEFSRKIIHLVSTNDSGLPTKQNKDFLNHYNDAANQNDKDYIVLQILPLICKQRGWVKIGKKSLKPSTQESKEAFILHVSDASEFDQALRDRQDRHSAFGAPVQPYIIVLGETDYSAKASYVIVNRVPWKLSSVLQAADTCMKTCFSLNCSYPPEAMHIWLLIQNFLYGIDMKNDVAVGTVISFIQKLENVPPLE